jgi:hypothetical protein
MKLRISIFWGLSFSCAIIFNSCRKDTRVEIETPYLQNETFFKRGNSGGAIGQISVNSTGNYKNDIIDSVMNMLKMADERKHFADLIIRYYGFAKWNYSITVKNANGLRTVIIPVVDTVSKTQLLIFAYQTTPERVYFKLIGRNTLQPRLPNTGNISGTKFTKQTLIGLFDSFDRAITESKAKGNTVFTVTRPNAMYVSYTCWYYTWSSTNGDFGISNTQCSYSLIVTPEMISNVGEVQNIPQPENGGGSPFSGGTTQDPLDQLYNCTCDCLEDDAMESYLNSFEPKWGQLGDLSAILLEIGKAKAANLNYNSASFKDRLEIIKNYFDANRFFTRNQYNQIVDESNSKIIDRYIYTLDRGWLDMHHVFYNIFLAEKYYAYVAIASTSTGELIQWLKGNESGYSYEDLPSNQAGIDFYKLYNAQIKNGSISLENAMAAFLIGIKATDPPNAPNYLVIPHVIDQYVPSNTSTKGLIGYDLLQKALESFCKKSSSRKAAIRQAHQTIFHSANN